MKTEEGREEEVTGSSRVDVDMKSENEDGIEDEEDESMNDYSFTVSLHTPELKLPIIPRELEQKPWREKHEQNNSDHHWRPIRHRVRDIVIIY